MNKHYVIAMSKIWEPNLVDKLANITGAKFTYITEKDKLSYELFKKLNPRYIFFPHWSYFIPAEIYEKFECVVFHMTDLPFGRGGSPLQNLIERGVCQTKISALKVNAELDGGDIYSKRELSLYGSAQEIYMKATRIIINMIETIIKTEPQPVSQVGKVIRFKRRIPEQSNIEDLSSIEKVFDYIRMLDADGYPAAFIEKTHLRFEFTEAEKLNSSIQAKVKITLREIK